MRKDSQGDHGSQELFRGKEGVVGGVRDTGFLVDVAGVAAGGGSFAAFGVEALDGGGVREDAVAFMAGDVNEEPGYGVRVGRVHAGNSFTVDTTGVCGHPGRTGEMFTESVAILVEEVGFGSFEDPRILVAIGLAGVDLVALCVHGEEESLVVGRLKLLGNLLSADGRNEYRS